MKVLINTYFFIAISLLLYSGSDNILAQGGNNNAFVFNGSTSQLYVYDNSPANSDADQNGFKFFNSSSANNKITVQAWIYLLGDNTGTKMPVVYRTVQGGTTFTLYVKDNKGYFSVGGSPEISTQEFPAFSWVSLTGVYDGSTLKIYSGGSLQQSIPYSLTPGYTGGQGLFIGKSDEGAFKGLIDEIRIFNIALGDNNINSSGGNGNPAEPFPSSISQYSAGQWSFTSISSGNLLNDLSAFKNHLNISDITQIVPSKNLPFFVVNSTSDEPDALPGDGSAVSLNGSVTLRSAIQEANTISGEQIIYFYLPGSGIQIIQPGSPLPEINDRVFLDGTSQKGFNGLPLVKTQGVYGGLILSGSGNTVQGLSLSSSSGFGLTLANSGGNNILNNHVAGIDISSPDNNINNNTFSNSGVGVNISDGAGNSILTDNLVSENTFAGISINTSAFSLSTENIISGNSGYGLVINGSDNKISNQQIYNNTGSGVFVEPILSAFEQMKSQNF
ncbi:MAG: LamG-like jellyroll fold domain-containing protein [Ignavibacteriaceae bacterium]